MDIFPEQCQQLKLCEKCNFLVNNMKPETKCKLSIFTSIQKCISRNLDTVIVLLYLNCAALCDSFVLGGSLCERSNQVLNKSKGSFEDTK